MDKLIEKFVAQPTEAARLRLQKYLYKHPMSVCLASPEQLAFLRANGLI
jgi:hypothetical protein